MKRLINIAILLLMLFSCEEAFDIRSPENDELLVVEALLTSESKPQEVRLSKTFTEIDSEPTYIENAIVALNDGDTTIILRHKADQPGTYVTDTLQALFGKVYTLYIQHDQREYFAQATSSFGSPLDPFEVNEVADGIFEFIYQESSEPSMTEVIVSWQEPDSLGQSAFQTVRAFFYSLNTIDINSVFAPDKEPLRFPSGAVLLRRKYSLTPDHQEFIRSLLAEVDWRGGIFDVDAGNVNTNLSEGAVGYFSVSMVRTDTTLIQ